MAQPTEAVAQKIDEIIQLYLLNAGTEKILSLVDEVFDSLTEASEICQLLEFLPRSLTTTKFIKVLEGEKSKRSVQIALANISAVDELKCDDESRRRVYFLMHETLATDAANSLESFRMLLKYLATFKKLEDTNEKVMEKACLAITEALRLPIWRFDEVSDLVPVRGLAASKIPANRCLSALFEVFSEKGVNDYQKFYLTNTELVDTVWGLSNAMLMEKIRLLSLCRMAQEHKASGEGVMTFTQIAAGLSVSEEEVEPLLIRAVGLQLLSARIDQVHKVVRVLYAHNAMFTHDQWRHLQETLGSWKDSVADLSSRFAELTHNHNQAQLRQ